jgi:hypothetical protein
MVVVRFSVWRFHSGFLRLVFSSYAMNGFNHKMVLCFVLSFMALPTDRTFVRQ